MGLFSRRPAHPPARPYCEVHDSARVTMKHWRDDAEVLSLGPTVENLLARLADGRMREVRGDCRLDEFLGLLSDEALASFALYFECGRCGALMLLDAAVRSSYPHYVEAPRKDLETTRFHDWPHLVDTLPEVPIRLQPAGLD